MDEQLGVEDERTRHDITSEPAIDPAVLDERDLQLLVSSPLAKPHYVGVFALRSLGHSLQEIADYFKVSRQGVHFAHKRALKILVKKKALQR